MMLRLGRITLDVSFFQAPLSGYSDYAMRQIARQLGCPLTFAGVMLAKSAANPKVLVKRRFRPGDDEHPIGAQILGAEPQEMADGAVALERAGYDIIDLNFACPAPKVLRRGRGGALLDEPQRAIEILKRVRSVVKCPLTVKLRIGKDLSSQSCEKFLKIVEAAASEGIDAITIHGRAVINSYRGKSDWEIVRYVKTNFPSLVVIGSGDLLSAEKAIEVFKDTGINGVVIARGAIGNPWIFRELWAKFKGEPKPAGPSMNEQRDVILRHFELVCQLYPGTKAVRYFRKFLVRYCRLHPQRKTLLAALMAADSCQELTSRIKQCFCRE